MMSVSRRTILSLCGYGVLVPLAGCEVKTGPDDDPTPTLRLFPTVTRTDTGWELTVRVRHKTDLDSSIHDVTVVAFSEEDTEVCRIPIGDFPQSGRREHTETVTCDGFPAIVTATAEEMPCDGANIEIVYWTGTDEQRGTDIPEEEFVWDYTFREYNEPLAPDRVLENVSKSNSSKLWGE